VRSVVPRPLLQGVRSRILVPLLTQSAERRLKRPRAGREHALPGELIVSLTSYPARFPTLHLTLACLLDQTVRADRTILWVARNDAPELPETVRVLEDRGLEVRLCDDLRSYKKLVPALQAFPDAFIATADDDIYYPRHWLERLVAGALVTPEVITCHRAHRIRLDAQGRLKPYVQWAFDVQDVAARRPSTDLLPTGAGGILYPPQSLDNRVTDRSLFERLCPDGDDLWFYWCARMAGTKHKKVGGKLPLIPWRGKQQSALWQSNECGGNDMAIAALQTEFGYPE